MGDAPVHSLAVAPAHPGIATNAMSATTWKPWSGSIQPDTPPFSRGRKYHNVEDFWVAEPRAVRVPVSHLHQQARTRLARLSQRLTCRRA